MIVSIRTVEIQLNMCIAFAERVLRRDLVLAGVGGVDIVDLQASDVGIVRQWITVDEIAAGVLDGHVVARPEQVRLGIGGDLAFEDEPFAVVLLLDDRLLNERRRGSLGRARREREWRVSVGTAGHLPGGCCRLSVGCAGRIVGREVQVHIGRDFACLVLHHDLVGARVRRAELGDFERDVMVASAGSGDRLLVLARCGRELVVVLKPSDVGLRCALYLTVEVETRRVVGRLSNRWRLSKSRRTSGHSLCRQSIDSLASYLGEDTNNNEILREILRVCGQWSKAAAREREK